MILLLSVLLSRWSWYSFHSQLHDHRSESLPDVFIIPVLCRELCDVKSLFLGVSRRTTVHVLGDVEQIALDSGTGRGLRAMARVAVIALVVLVLCIYLLANAQEFEGPAISSASCSNAPLYLFLLPPPPPPPPLPPSLLSFLLSRRS